MSDVAATQKIKISTIAPGQYLSDVLPPLDELLPDGGLLFIDAPLGSGKNEWATREATKLPSLCVISAETALVASLAQRFDAVDYHKIDSSAPTPPRIATTTHSASRFRSSWDLTVVDEAPLVRAAWTSKTCQGYGSRAKDATVGHLARSKWAVVMSADLDNEEIQWWTAAYLARKNAPVKVVEVERPQGARMLLHLRPSALEAAFFQAVEKHTVGGPPLLAFLSDTKLPSQWARRVQKHRPDLRVWWISSTNSDVMAGDLQNPNRILEKNDVILCSPSIRSGLSWTAPVQQVFVRCSIGDFGARAIAQQVMRARNVRNICAPVSWTGPLHSRSPEAAIRDFEQWWEGHHEISLAIPVVFDFSERNGTRRAYDTELFDCWVAAESRARRESQDRTAALKEVADEHRWSFLDRRDVTPTEDTAEGFVVDRREARVLVTANDTGRIVAGSQGQVPLTRKEQRLLSRARAVFKAHELTTGQALACLQGKGVDGLEMLLQAAKEQMRRKEGGGQPAPQDVARVVDTLDAAGIDLLKGGEYGGENARAVGKIVRDLGGKWKPCRRRSGNRVLRLYKADFSKVWELCLERAPAVVGPNLVKAGGDYERVIRAYMEMVLTYMGEDALIPPDDGLPSIGSDKIAA